MKNSQCAFCAKSFRYRPNKRYCSDKCRFQAWMRGQTEPEIKPCFYCGMPASTIDHVPPRCVRETLLEMNEQRWPLRDVDACHECNSLAGAEPPWTLAGRKEMIKKKLRKKYARFFKLPDWTPEEISELEPRGILERHVSEGMIIKQAIKKRIQW